MRISDWSSDVCSSDPGTDASLARAGRRRPIRAKLARQETIGSATAMTGSPSILAAGNVAVLTGAGSGFGRELALLCAARGMKLVLADIQPAALDAILDLPAGNYQLRSEERSVGKECVRTCRSRWSAYPEKKNITK